MEHSNEISKNPIVFVNIISRKLCTNLKINSRIRTTKMEHSTFVLILLSKFHLFALRTKNIFLHNFFVFLCERQNETWILLIRSNTKGNKNYILLSNRTEYGYKSNSQLKMIIICLRPSPFFHSFFIFYIRSHLSTLTCNKRLFFIYWSLCGVCSPAIQI